MASVPFWGQETRDEEQESSLDLPGDWDTLVWGGQVMPGLATVELTQAMKVQHNKARGKHGGTPIFQGREPAKNIDIRIVIWTAAQLRTFQERLAVLWPNEPGKKEPTPFDIVHPNTTLLGIKSAFPVEVSGLKDGPVHGAKTCTIKAQEFRLGDKKKNATKRAKSSKGVDNVIAPERLQKPKPGPAGQSASPSAYTPANQNFSTPSGDANFTAPR